MLLNLRELMLQKVSVVEVKSSFVVAHPHQGVSELFQGEKVDWSAVDPGGSQLPVDVF